jgi:hypothetical protein
VRIAILLVHYKSNATAELRADWVVHEPRVVAVQSNPYALARIMIRPICSEPPHAAGAPSCDFVSVDWSSTPYPDGEHSDLTRVTGDTQGAADQ